MLAFPADVTLQYPSALASGSWVYVVLQSQIIPVLGESVLVVFVEKQVRF